MGGRIEINGERWYTRQQLCLKLKISGRTMYDWVDSHKIEKKKIDGLTFYKEIDG